MSSTDRIELFLKYQKQNMSFEDISNKLGIKPATLRRSLNKNGYKFEKGIYVKSIDESQLSFDDVTNNKKRKTTPKKDKKINISQEDMDKLCEVYDWYIQVKDNKVFRPKKLSSKKDIILEDTNVKDFKSVSIKVDKETWEDFDRLCCNSAFNKKEIITQALKDFMKTYKNLL